MGEFSVEDMPFETDESGAECWQHGYELALAGLTLDRIMWDCDELLWDWCLRARGSLKRLAKLVRRDYTHREWVRTKPGVWELIWGLHHGSLETGKDGQMRVATNGYAWRLWRMSRHIPGFCELIGEGADSADYETWRDHPMLYCRPDYAKVAGMLLRGEVEVEDGPAAVVIAEHVDVNPKDSTLKLPEMAVLAGKPGFANVQILIDDSFHNIRRFARTGRVGIHVDVPAKRDRKTSRLPQPPNTIWKDARSYLDRVSTPLGPILADKLAEALTVRSSDILVAHAQDADGQEHRVFEFDIEVTGEVIQTEWLEPMRRMRKQLKT